MVFPKFTQTFDDQIERIVEENSKPAQLKKSVEDTKEFLIRLANENSWNITNIDENGIQVKADRNMVSKTIIHIEAKYLLAKPIGTEQFGLCPISVENSYLR